MIACFCIIMYKKEYEDFMEDYCELSELCNEFYFIKGFSKANKLRNEALMR